VKVVVTGGGGFIGSHVVEHYAKTGADVLALDNFSRWTNLGTHPLGKGIERYNWDYIARLPGVALKEVDVRDERAMQSSLKGADLIVHAAGQVAVTTSVVDPRTDFETNVGGTFNVLEGARKTSTDPVLILCSTNKVYGGNVNRISIRENGKRYAFADPAYADGIPENFPTDHAHHTPYGASKYSADIYAQEYAHTYGLRAGVFRMSCIYGPRQFGMEDQGWIAHFAISGALHKPLTIYGDGKQVRDVLFVEDLVRAYEAYAVRSKQLGGQVFNMGGGKDFTLSLLELVGLLEDGFQTKLEIAFADWRPADQKVFVSDIRKARENLKWAPETNPVEGVRKVLAWIRRERLAET
jgi:CDP-paratose 2-epimerase